MLLPARFGKYILLKEIEMGGMAAVYLAKARSIAGFEKFLAIKRIFPQLSRNEDFVEMFFAEARIASDLNHPNISHIYDLGQEEGDYFIAMEYIHGKDAFRLLRRCKTQGRQLPLPLAGFITLQILQGLDYAHRKKDHRNQPMNIVHRDVSPRNVLVSYEGNVKLIDFGIAKASVQNTHTQAGTIKGKINYMSPEQARGEELDARSDLFAVGLLLYELIFQAKLFKGTTEIHTLELIRECNLPDFRVNFPELPEELDAILVKALARDRAERFQSAQQFIQALNHFLVRYSTVPGQTWLSEFMQECFGPEINGEQRELESFRSLGDEVVSGMHPVSSPDGGAPTATMVQPLPDSRQMKQSGTGGSGQHSESRSNGGQLRRVVGGPTPSSSTEIPEGPDDLVGGDLHTSIESLGEQASGGVGATRLVDVQAHGDTASPPTAPPQASAVPTSPPLSSQSAGPQASEGASPVPFGGARRNQENRKGLGPMIGAAVAVVMVVGGGYLVLSPPAAPVMEHPVPADPVPGAEGAAVQAPGSAGGLPADAASGTAGTSPEGAGVGAGATAPVSAVASGAPATGKPENVASSTSPRTSAPTSGAASPRNVAPAGTSGAQSSTSSAPVETKPEPVAAVVPEPTPRAPEPIPPPVATPAPAPVEPVKPVAVKPVSDDPRGFGKASVNASFPCVVKVDGVVVGNTPLKDLKLAVGKRRIELERISDKTSKVFEIEVKSQQVHPVLWRGGE